MCHVVLSSNITEIFQYVMLFCTEFIAVLNHFGLQRLAISSTPLRCLVVKYKFILDSISQLLPGCFPKACLNACLVEAFSTGCHGLDCFSFDPWEPHFSRQQCVLLCTLHNLYFSLWWNEQEEEGSELHDSKFNLMMQNMYVVSYWNVFLKNCRK